MNLQQPDADSFKIFDARVTTRVRVQLKFLTFVRTERIRALPWAKNFAF